MKKKLTDRLMSSKPYGGDRWNMWANIRLLFLLFNAYFALISFSVQIQVSGKSLRTFGVVEDEDPPLGGSGAGGGASWRSSTAPPLTKFTGNNTKSNTANGIHAFLLFLFRESCAL